MAQIIREIRVDVSQPNVFQAIVAKQLDCNSRFLKIILVDFGVKIEVPETAKVTINANRPDGKSQSFMGVANNDGTITVPLAQWMLEVAGELKCDVSVINTTDNKRLTSTDFYVNVQEAANKSTDISENPDGEIRVITPTQKIDKNSSDDEYPSAKAVYELDNITTTATGSAITIDSAKAPLQNLKLFGKTTQNGTPTPSTPVPLVSVGDSGSFELGVYSGNIINEAHFSGSNGTDYVEFVNGKIHFVNASGNSFSCATITVKLPKGTYYLNMKTHSHTTKSAPVGIGQTTEQQYINGVSNSTIKYVFDKTTYLQIRLTTQAYKEVGEFYANVWLVAEKNCEYQPYVAKQSLTIPYILRGIDDEDEIDFAGGIQIQRVREYSLIKFIGTCEQTDNTAFSNNILRFDFMYSLKSKPQTQVKSNRFVFNYIHGENASSARNTECVSTHAGVDRVSVLIDKSRLSTPDFAGFKEFLENNETIIQVVLATPNEVALTETELNAYRHLMTNKGNTTILNSDGADMEISYYVNKPNAQAIGSLHEQINKDYLKLQQAIISTGGSTL